MPKTVLAEDANATIKRLESIDRGLKQALRKAYGYAVFPSVGKAAAVVGGAYGHGMVFERGKRIGYATIAQMTVGVQIGGDTFSEVLIFESKQAMDRFKRGKIAFAANASAVLVNAGAAGTKDPQKGITALAYSRGGMMLELAIGGQKFKFRPLGDESESEPSARGKSSEDAGEEADEDGEASDAAGMLGRAVGGARGAVSKAGDLAREHPVLTTLAGAGLAAGLAILAARAARQSGSDRDSDHDEEDGDDHAQDEYGEDEQDDEGEAEDDDDSGDEESEADERPAGRRARARVRS